MTDVVERLRNHVNNRGGASLQNGAWQMMLDAADEIERCREMCINREEFIASKDLWGEFGAYVRDNPSLEGMVAGITEENRHNEVRVSPPTDETGRLRETLEHVTELLVDTWHTAMDGEPEKEAAVVDARALLEALK
jgi:hypothetical protein